MISQLTDQHAALVHDKIRQLVDAAGPHDAESAHLAAGMIVDRLALQGHQVVAKTRDGTVPVSDAVLASLIAESKTVYGPLWAKPETTARPETITLTSRMMTEAAARR